MQTLYSFKAVKISILFFIPLVSTHGFYAFGQTTAPDINPIQLLAEPLYAQGSGQRPTLTLALSVEYPTVGAQFRDGYTEASDYLGYFDINSCYAYNNDTNEDNRRFERIGVATNHKCGGIGFSGNFMNWATSSSIDLLRYGLTGGDRIRDEENLTVLQRAVLKTTFWNSGSDFKQKLISNAIAIQALPSGMLKGHAGDVHISNCLNRVFFSTVSANGSCDGPDFTKSLGAKKSSGKNAGPADTSEVISTDMFFTRVKVCESNGGNLKDPRTSLCQRYPNGNFKPVGNMQKYSDRIRVAAFGYLLQDGTGRYGGVLRAPMTYVGPTAYDENGTLISGGNSYAEWNKNSGIFLPNPRNATDVSNSGVINYLNKFGRSGNYKSNDPVGELYYESLRYLQGLQPTTQAVSSITLAHKDGFPAYTEWTDPFKEGSSEKNYSCLRNSILLIGDVNTHADKSLPGNSRTGFDDFNRTADVNLTKNIPNFVEWTNVIAGFEANKSVGYIDGDNANRTTGNNPKADSSLGNLASVGTGSGGSSAYYIAGAAYWAHTHDIRGKQWSETTKQRPGMRITTYVIDVNENQAQSKFPVDRRRSQFFLTAKYGGFYDVDGDGNPFTPVNDDNKYDSRHWAKTNDPEEAKNYFLASDAKAVLTAIDEIFFAASQASNAITPAAVSSSTLSTDDGYFYLPSFDAEFWSGDLKRNTIKLNNLGEFIQEDPAKALSAAKKLDSLTDTGTSSRKIFVGKTSSVATGYATEFTWSNIQSELKGNLNKGSPTAEPDGSGENRLKFLRGYQDLGGTNFRIRASRMGDVINSGVAYSAAPTTRYTTKEYQDFYKNNKNRTKAVFVGANDGMLHAFNAITMEELFAYIPSWLGPKLSVLTAADYASSRHTSYVDATPVVAEAQLGSDWKTILVSGTGAGGQGVFALDITNPADFKASNVLWEFTDADDPSLGNVVGSPKIVKIRTSAPDTKIKTYKWFAVVPSGVNNYVNDGVGRFSATGQPAIFLLDLSKPSSENWSKGTNYFKIEFPVSNDLSLGTQSVDATGKGTGTSIATGIINFEATSNSDNSVQYFYVGDLHGQLWKLNMDKSDLSSSAESSWNLDKVSYFNKNNNARPLFIAKDSKGKVQPISMTPSIAYGPNGTYIVAFGTGKYLEASDNAISIATQKQSFYALYDRNGEDTESTKLESNGTARFSGRDQLQQGVFSSTGELSVSPFYWTHTEKINSKLTNKKAGWVVDFKYSGVIGGEKQVTNAVLFGNRIFFNSILPPTASTDACGGGISYPYTVNLATGNGSVSAATNGAVGSPLIFITNKKESISNSTGGRTTTVTAKIGSPSSNESQLKSTTITATMPTGRLSWRKINNYQDLKNKSWEK